MLLLNLFFRVSLTKNLNTTVRFFTKRRSQFVCTLRKERYMVMSWWSGSTLTQVFLFSFLFNKFSASAWYLMIVSSCSRRLEKNETIPFWNTLWFGNKFSASARYLINSSCSTGQEQNETIPFWNKFSASACINTCSSCGTMFYSSVPCLFFLFFLTSFLWVPISNLVVINSCSTRVEQSETILFGSTFCVGNYCHENSDLYKTTPVKTVFPWSLGSESKATSVVQNDPR